MVQLLSYHGSDKYTYNIDTVKFFQERNKPIPEKFIERTTEELGIITDPAIARQVVKGWGGKK